MIGSIFGNSSLMCSTKNKFVPTLGLVMKVFCLLLAVGVTAGTIYAVNAPKGELPFENIKTAECSINILFKSINDNSDQDYLNHRQPHRDQ